MSATRIKPCSCKPDTPGAKYQDERYGAGMRVHNACGDGKWRCTCCGATRD